MKTYFTSFLFSVLVLGMVSLLQMSYTQAQWGDWWNNGTIINRNSGNVVVSSEWNDDSDFIRVGASQMAENDQGGTVDNIINPKEIKNHGQAVQAVQKLIQIIINWFLGIVGLVALGYLLYNGFIMTTARGDEKQFDKGKAGIKTAVVALAGLTLSRLVISMIFWIIDKLVTSS